MIDCCVGFLVANPRSRTVRRNFYRRGIDRRRTMFYFVAEKWQSVTPPAVNLIDAFGWSLTHCVGETHYHNQNKRSSFDHKLLLA